MKNGQSLIMMMVLLVAVACKPTVPSDYIQPADMEEILYDYHLADAIARNENDGNVALTRNTYFHAVLKKHHVTEAEFDSSLVYYYSHIDRLKTVYTHVNDRLTEEAKRLGTSVGDISRYSDYTASGDTANIWTGATDVLLIPHPTANRYDFTFDVDSTFRKGDSFMLQFVAEYIWQSGAKDAVACVCAVYEGDSIVQSVSHVGGQGVSQLRIPSVDKKLERLSGYVYLSDSDNERNVRQMMFLSQLQFIRFHPQTPLVTHEKEAKDSIKTDSVQRADNTRGKVSGAVRNRVVERTSDASASVDTRATSH